MNHVLDLAIRRPAATGQRGQVLPLFAIFLFVLIALVALCIDGSLMLQSRQDLQTIATHAASSGAQDLDWTTYEKLCTAKTGSLTCAGYLRLDGDKAPARAEAVAKTWLHTLDPEHLGIPSSDVAGSDIKVELSDPAPGSTERQLITVTVTRCYKPYLAGAVLSLVGGSGSCPSGSLAITESASAVARLGY